MFPKILLSVLFLLGLVSSALAVGDLGITKDASLGKQVKAYNSKCTFKEKPSDAEFLLMIKTAWHDMNSSVPDGPKHWYDTPYAMIGLAIDDEVYFASSTKAGKRQLIYQKTENAGGQGEFQTLPDRYQAVIQALKKCTDDNPTKKVQHGNNAACGEIMSTILWMHDHDPEKPKDHNPRVAAWCQKGYLPPCSSEADSVTWGCGDWTNEMGYTVVDNIDLPESYTKPEKSEAVSLNQCLELSPREKAKAKADSKTKAAS